MSNTMTEFKATADSHMVRDIAAGGEWNCQCEACHGIRSLTGLDKILKVRTFVRRINELKNELAQMPEDAEKQNTFASYLKLQEELAAEMAR
jgi:hypothetical protein